MIVSNIGYLKLEQVLELIRNKNVFSIYYTRKNTMILVKDTTQKQLDLYYPKKDRLQYKLVDGKKITFGNQVFNSVSDGVELLDTTKWNNGNQIMSYEPYKI